MNDARNTTLPLVILGAAIAAAVGFVVAFPAVEGLGNKVKLPVFHGALTWVNLAVFSLLGLAGLVYLVRQPEATYPWERALRWVGVGMWTTSSVLGYIAATQTWDFTGSKASPFEVAMADPRLIAQFWIMLAGLALIAASAVLENKRVLAALDTGFVVLMWAVLMRAVLGPGRALHPDSPVMNSEEIGIKLLFFGMVGSLLVAALSAAWLLVRSRFGEDSSAESNDAIASVA